MNKKKLPRAIRPDAAEAGGVAPAPVADEPAPERPARVKEKKRHARAAKGGSIMTQETQSPDTASAEERRAAAEKVVERFSLYSGAAGLIPLPGVDLATVGGVQIQMLRRLSQIYGVPFSNNRGKALVAALAGALVPATSGMGAVSLVKSVPVAGTVVAVMAMPTLSAGATYTIGTAFIEHFASGGTLLDFNPPDYRAFLKARKEKKEKD
jgi:uncharacterized protein (DUF697 family)